MSAILTPTVAAQGPKMIAKIVAPTACAEVPSGMGTLYIIIVKDKAAPIANSGTCLSFNVFFNFAAAVPIIGTITAPIMAQVWGLKYPSGMCIISPPKT